METPLRGPGEQELSRLGVFRGQGLPVHTAPACGTDTSNCHQVVPKAFFTHRL
jgi:hypothetical protein